MEQWNLRTGTQSLYILMLYTNHILLYTHKANDIKHVWKSDEVILFLIHCQA